VQIQGTNNDRFHIAADIVAKPVSGEKEQTP
jgi:hypothetical protein